MKCACSYTYTVEPQPPSPMINGLYRFVWPLVIDFERVLCVVCANEGMNGEGI